MIQIHTGHHRHIRIEYVNRIQPSAQADFEYHHIDLLADKHIHRSQGVEFKISQRNFTARRFYSLKSSDDGFIGNRLAVDGDAFVEFQQMGAGKRTGFKTGLRINLGEKRANRTFSVGACYGDYRTRRNQSHTFFDFAYPLQAHINQAVAVGSFQMGEPLC